MDTHAPSADTIHGLFSQWVRHAPDAPAVHDGDVRLTYGELDEASGRMAVAIIGQGLAVGTPVGVVGRRSAEFVVCFLAVLKAGCVLVPIDPDLPARRVAAITEDARLTTVLSLVDGWESPDGVSIVGTTAVAEPMSLPAVRGSDLAYLMYTSGSTGVPKGVLVEHSAVVNLVQDDSRLSVQPGHTVAHLAPVSFDAAVFEIWGALCRGGTVVTVMRAGVAVSSLAADLRAHRPDWLFLTTGLFHLLMETDPDALRSVGVLITGGDVLSPQHVRAAAAFTKVATYAAYGPTETTVFASLHRADPARTLDAVPLGTALAGRTMVVLDDDLCEPPAGVVGEVFLGGRGLARGYHRQEALTAERFVPDPRNPGALLYRTGDRGRLLPTGEVDFNGRTDRQVKIRGYRIELGEIEVALGAHPAVVAAAVSAPAGADSARRLVAYVVPTRGTDLRIGDIRAWLGQRLPTFALPSNYVLVDAVELDANGKLDRRRLPAPWTNRSDRELDEYVAPATSVERAVAELMADVLGMDLVGREDDFFDLGGDSLRAARALEGLRSLGFEVSVRDFFANPTAGGVAGLLESAGAEPGFGRPERRPGPA